MGLLRYFKLISQLFSGSVGQLADWRVRRGGWSVVCWSISRSDMVSSKSIQ